MRIGEGHTIYPGHQSGPGQEVRGAQHRSAWFRLEDVSLEWVAAAMAGVRDGALKFVQQVFVKEGQASCLRKMIPVYIERKGK